MAADDSNRYKKLVESTKNHEGSVKKNGKHVVYDDANGEPITSGDTVEGKPTGVYGRNLQERGFTEKEAEYLLKNDLQSFEEKCKSEFSSFWDLLNGPRKNVIVEMAFNMGVGSLIQFKNMITALEESNYKTAAEEMLASRWAKQVHSRANKLAKQMRTGEYVE